MPELGDLVVPLAGGEGVTADRIGPKAATLAMLHRAGMNVPTGWCLTADAYRVQLRSAGVEDTARRLGDADGHDARKLALAVRLGLIRAPLAPGIAEALERVDVDVAIGPGRPLAVRSSALLEDSPRASFAGQFDSFLGITAHADLVTAVRACWASLWSTRALRYMQAHELDPGRTAMAVLIQELVPARSAGGALSRTPQGEILITGTWGLGSAVAQGEVVPDRFLLERDGSIASEEPGRKERLVACSPEAGPLPRPVSADLVTAPCLGREEVVELGRMVLAAESRLGMPVEIEWAKDDRGFHLLQARPLTVESPHIEDEAWLHHPGMRGQPSGLGWSTGPARVVLHEHDLEHVNVGDVLVTQVAGPALTAVLPRVAGIVAELGGSTSHLAALARERGIPAVLGLVDVTRRIPDGALVAVDGVAGVVRWIA
jgi:pyruvate,water dikinase